MTSSSADHHLPPLLPLSSTSGCSPSVCSSNSSFRGPWNVPVPMPNFGQNSLCSTTNKSPPGDCFSLEGPLFMKCFGSFALSSFLQPRKRVYFGLEVWPGNRLVYYRTKADFDARRDCLGQILLSGCFCSLVEGNLRAFLLHTNNGKKYQLEADNSKTAECWLSALEQRREENGDGKTGRKSDGLARINGNSKSEECGQNNSDSEQDRAELAGLQRQPARRRRRFLPPLRLDNVLLSGGGHSRGTLAELDELGDYSTSPPTPVSMPSPLIERVKWPNKMGQIPLRKSVSVVARMPMDGERNGGDLTGHRQINGCCVCEGQQTWWMVDSWLQDQQQDTQLIRDTSQDGQTVDENRANNSEGGRQVAEAQEFDSSPVPPLCFSNNNNTHHHHQSVDPSSPLSSACESAGAMEAAAGTNNELNSLRELSNRQKERIRELSAELERMKKLGGTDGVSTEQSFAAHHRFLNAELFRINERRLKTDKMVEEYKRQLSKLELEMEEFKKEYVHVLQSSVRIPLRDNSACDVVQVKLFGGDEHERRVRKLLEHARQSSPGLPTFESITHPGSFHIDEFGFRHSFEDTSLAVHYIATQLQQHYRSQSTDQIKYKASWRALLKAHPDCIERTRETRLLCRRGIPNSFRSRVWHLLIHQRVADLKQKHGPYYFRELCSSQGTPAEKYYNSTHQKQITLDLLRTMPTNVHFTSASCKGVTQLQSVLRAYCLHNPNIGYCQGMNFLVATALLFMDAEDAFWFLVAITERYFDPSYFDQSLTGAQADQEVLKEIVEQKYPRLANHLEECEIDLTTVSLNWFLALFFDAVPFQTMLRLWDCFVYEGPKVLFRFAVALLGFHEEELLAHSDTISVIKVLKAAVRLTLDVDGLIKFAFEELNPFPSKAYLRHRQSLYLRVLQQQLHRRRQLRQLVMHSPTQSDQLCLSIEVVAFSPFIQGRAYVCAGNQKRGKLSMIQFGQQTADLSMLELEFDCRPVSMVLFHPEMAFVSLLSGYIVAIHLRSSDKASILWELKLNDVALKLVHCSQRLYCCLANGTLTVIENAFERLPSTLDLFHIPIAAAPITDALLDDEHDLLFLAVACKIAVLNCSTLTTLASQYVASAASGSQVPMFEKIRCLAHSPHGIWLTTAHSSLLQLWQNGQCQMLFDIRYDHSHRKPSFDDQEEESEQVEVSAMLYHDEELWIGTSEGYLMLYRLFARPPPIGSPGSSWPVPCRFQPGKRLSAAYGLGQQVPAHKQHTYYIPTESETRMEERNSCMETRMEEEEKEGTRMDEGERKDSVKVEYKGTIPYRMPLASCASMAPTEGSSSSVPELVRTTSTQPKAKFCTQQSVDSAFFSGFFASNSTTNPDNDKNKESAPVIRTRLSGSLSTDDIFEVYSEAEEEGRRMKDVGEEEKHHQDRVKSKMEEERDGEEEEEEEPRNEETEEYRKRLAYPSRLVRIHSWRKMSSMSTSAPFDDYATEPEKIPPKTSGQRRMSAPTGAEVPSPSANTEESGTVGEEGIGDDGQAAEGAVRIRRKDLTFEEPMLLAVKENDFIQSFGTLSASGDFHSNASNSVKVPADSMETPTELEINNSLSMALQMKLKVSDKSMRCIALGHFGDQDVVVTGAGEYGDEEALLRWHRDPNSALWVNYPLVDSEVRGRTRTLFSGGQQRPSLSVGSKQKG